jgi:hypothetical protein
MAAWLGQAANEAFHAEVIFGDDRTSACRMLRRPDSVDAKSNLPRRTRSGNLSFDKIATAVEKPIAASSRLRKEWRYWDNQIGV